MQLKVFYQGECVGTFYADLVVEGLVILELKAVEELTKRHQAQVLHYLRSSEIEIGYVLCFGEKADFKRVFLSNSRKLNLRS